MRLLTTSETAAYLRLKERKLYELIAEGQIPCTKVTGKWLFPKDELDRWLSLSLTRPDGMTRAEPMPIVGGSHDPLLEWALRESGSGLATLPEGSEAGLERFARSELVAAAIHLHALESGEIDANLAVMNTMANLHDAVLIGFARREQGILTAAGNPLGLRNLRDVIRQKARFVPRQDGAGAQLLLQSLIHREQLPSDEINKIASTAPTGGEVAQAIRAGRADSGIATRSVANAVGIDFVPLVWEQFDIVARQRDYFRKPMQTFLRFLKTPAFANRAAEMGGYDVAQAGAIRFSP